MDSGQERIGKDCLVNAKALYMLEFKHRHSVKREAKLVLKSQEIKILDPGENK